MTSFIFGILLTFLVFFIIVFVHEFGHFIVARWTGMQVKEFGFGIPPRMRKLFRDKKGTLFTLNWLPIGGFVQISGEDPSSEDAFKKGSFMSKSLPKRLLVLVAGVTMNFILAWIIFFGFFLWDTSPKGILPNGLVEGTTSSYFLPSLDEAIDRGTILHDGIVLHPLEESIATKSGIQSGDKVLQVDGKIIDRIEAFAPAIASKESHIIKLLRKGEEHSVVLTPLDGRIGTRIEYENMRMGASSSFSVGESAVLAVHETVAMTRLTFSLFTKMLGELLFPQTPMEREEAKQMLAGPIGLGGAFVSMVDQGITVSLISFFVALLSINLAVINILPFPALDGGRMVTTLLYSCFSFWKRGKEFFLKFETLINAFGFIVLLALMAYVAILDISRFF